MNAKQTKRKSAAQNGNVASAAKTFVLRLPPSMVSALDERAKDNCRTRNGEVRSILTNVLKGASVRA